MPQNLELLEEIQQYTKHHPGIAIKACTDRSDCWIYVDGEEKSEPRGTAPFPIKKPGEPVEFMSLVLTTFQSGQWNEELQRFQPESDVLNENDFHKILKG